MTDSWKRQVVPMKRQQRIIETSWARGYARVLYELKVPAEDIEETRNLFAQTPELLERPWYVSCDVSKYIALLIDSLNHEASISALLDPHDRIKNRLAEYAVTHTIKEDNN